MIALDLCDPARGACVEVLLPTTTEVVRERERPRHLEAGTPIDGPAAEADLSRPALHPGLFPMPYGHDPCVVPTGCPRLTIWSCR